MRAHFLFLGCGLITCALPAQTHSASIPIDECYCDELVSSICPNYYQFEAAVYFVGGDLGDSRYNFIPTLETLWRFPGARSFYAWVTVNEVTDTLTFEEEGEGPYSDFRRCSVVWPN